VVQDAKLLVSHEATYTARRFLIPVTLKTL